MRLRSTSHLNLNLTCSRVINLYLLVYWHVNFNLNFILNGSIIYLSLSPSPRTQMHQWQLSISCTWTGTRTSLGFIGLMVFMLQKWKNDVPRVFVTTTPGIIRGWALEFILCPKLKQNREKFPLAFNPNPNEDESIGIWIHILYSYLCEHIL